jgi:hypothetical protein
MDKIQSEHHGNMVKLAEQETTNSELVYDINGELIAPDWACLFAGFFWGEGTFIIQPQHNGKNFNPYCQVWLREDDGHILKLFQARLGGLLRRVVKDDGSSPQIAWRVNRVEDCLRIGKLLQNTASLPFLKRDQLPIWLEALFIKSTRAGAGNGKLTINYLQEMSKLTNHIKALKAYDRNKALVL